MNALRGARHRTMSTDKRDEWRRTMLMRGHSPVMNEFYGEDYLDVFANKGGLHNGPACSACGWSTCWHCNPDASKAVPVRCAGEVKTGGMEK